MEKHNGRVEFICGGCNKREAGRFSVNGDAIKPSDWYIRGDEDGTQIACSRRCIQIISERTGKPNTVLPV